MLAAIFLVPLGACRICRHRSRHIISSLSRFPTAPNPAPADLISLGPTHRRHHASQLSDSKQQLPMEVDELDVLRFLVNSKMPEGRSPLSTTSLALLGPADSASVFTSSLETPLTRIAYLRELVKDATVAKKTHGDMWPSFAAINRLPVTAFSELLRSLDPLSTLSKELDSTAGMHVGPGMALETPIGQEFDIWGVRKVFVLLLERLMCAAELRIEGGHRLLPSDVQILLRSAGAASNYLQVKKIWHLVHKHKLREDGAVHNDFIKARFLTEDLYTQYDLERLRVRPLNQRYFKNIQPEPHPVNVKEVMSIARKRLRNQAHRFGHNRNKSDIAENLTRLMRNPRPPIKLFNAVVSTSYPPEERVLCSFMVAFARAGSLYNIENWILRRFWNIAVQKSRCNRFSVTGTSLPFTADSPLHPTELLLEAIIDSYGCNSQPLYALKLLNAVRHKYRIPMTERLWFKLFQWTYVASANMANCEHRLLHRDRIVPGSVLPMIWDIMKTENIKPGFLEYCLRVKDMIRHRQWRRAIGSMLELEPMYRDVQAELETAFYKQALTHALGLEDTGTQKAWHDALVQKQATWYAFQRLCRSILNQRRFQASVDNELFTQLFPQFIDAFRATMPRVVKYPVSSGTVELSVQPVERMTWRHVEIVQPLQLTGDLRDQEYWEDNPTRQPAVFGRPYARPLDLDKFLRRPPPPWELAREFL